MKPIRVLLVEDHTLMRAGIRSLLQGFSGLEIVEEASDGLEAVHLAEIHRPDVILMDISMRGLNGLEATNRITKAFPQVRVLMLSMHASEEYVLRALQVGASGYILKDASPGDLERAIQAVARGQAYLSPSVSRYVVDYVRHADRDGNSGPFEKLTPRQREILQLIAEGLTTRDIAERLFISPTTVETHRAQLMERLDIHNVPGLVRYAVQVGIVKTDE